MTGRRASSIEYYITEGAWQEARLHRLAGGTDPTYDETLYGLCKVRIGGTLILQHDAASIAALACGLARARAAGFPEDAHRRCEIDDLEGSWTLELVFEPETASVTVTETHRGRAASAPADQVAEAIDSFLRDFTREGVEHVPGFAMWGELRDLLVYHDQELAALLRQVEADRTASPPRGKVAQVLKLAVSPAPEDARRLDFMLREADDELIEGLLDWLGNWYWGHAASQALMKLGPGFLPALQRRAEGQEHVPASALWVLGQVRDPRSVELALSALEKGAPSVQAAAAEALGELGDVRAIPLLRACLAGSDRTARCKAAYALGALGDRESLPAIVELSSETGDDPEDDFEDLRWAFCALGELGGSAAVRRLREAVNDRALEQAAFQGLHALAKEHPDEARPLYPTLETRLDDDRWYVVEEAVDVLGLIADPALVPMLRAFAERPEIPSYRAADAAAEILDKIGTKEAREVATLLRERRVRWSAQSALEEWQTLYSNRPPLGPVLRQSHAHIWTRLQYLPRGRRRARNAEDEQTVAERFDAIAEHLGFSLVAVLAIRADPRDEELEVLGPLGAVTLPVPAEWKADLGELLAGGAGVAGAGAAGATDAAPAATGTEAAGPATGATDAGPAAAAAQATATEAAGVELAVAQATATEAAGVELAVAQLPWTVGCLDALWRAAARDRIGRVTVFNLPTGDALCPGDGGADVFVWHDGSRAALRQRFRSWLPDEKT